MSSIVRGDEAKENRGALVILNPTTVESAGSKGAIGQTLWLEVSRVLDDERVGKGLDRIVN